MRIKTHIIHILEIILFTIIFSSCSLHKLREAQEVVYTSGSVQDAGALDSTTLLNAYEILKKWQYFVPSDYVQACYQCGHFYKEKNDPVKAMHYFINATHTYTKDYSVKASVFKQMGIICYNAEDFELAYDMYDLSAQNFMQNGDTLRLCQVLHLQTLNLISQGKTEEAIEKLAQIENYNIEAGLRQQLLLTRSQIFLQTATYDSAFYYLKKYALYNLTDSAEIQTTTESLGFLESLCTMYKNASEGDEVVDWNELMGIIIGHQVSIDDEMSKKIKETSIHATQMLWNDIHHKKNLAWIYSIFVTLIVVGLVLVLVYNYKERRHTLLQQKITDASSEYNDLLESRINQIESVCKVLRSSATLQKDIYWRDYDKMCEKINDSFYLIASKLKTRQVLNETEVRLCVLILIGLDHNQIAHVLPYARNSIGKLKDQTAKKLGTTGRNLRDFLLNLSINS